MEHSNPLNNILAFVSTSRSWHCQICPQHGDFLLSSLTLKRGTRIDVYDPTLCEYFQFSHDFHTFSVNIYSFQVFQYVVH